MRILRKMAVAALATFLLATTSPWARAEIRRAEQNVDSEGIRPNVPTNSYGINLWGYIDRTGKFVIPPRFDEAYDFVSGAASAKLKNKDVVIDRNGKVIKKSLSGNYCCDDVIIPFHKDIYDESGKKVIAPGAKGVEVHRFNQGLAAFHLPVELGVHFYEQFFHGETWGKAEGTYGYINEQGRIVVPPRYTSAANFKDGIAIVEEALTSGYLNLSGKLIDGKMHHATLEPFNDGVGVFQEGGTYKFIDKNGAILASGFDGAGHFTDGLAPVQRGPIWSLIDKTGKTIRKLDFDRIESSSEGLAEVTKGGRKGFMNATGDLVIPLQFDDTRPFKNGLAAVSKGPSKAAKLKTALDAQNWSCSFIDRSGRIAFKNRFEGAKIFKEGLAPVLSGAKWGYIDHTGNFRIKPQFDDADLFSEGLAAVQVNSKWGYINKDGKFVIEPKFATDPNSDFGTPKMPAGRFVSGIALVEYPQRHSGFINKAGQSVLSNLTVDYEGKSTVNSGLILITSGVSTPFRNGYFNTAGKLVANCASAYPRPFSGGYARFYIYPKTGGFKIGFIDKTGKVVVQPTWDSAKDFAENLVAVSHGSQLGKGDYEGKWGFIDVNGKYACGLKFDAADYFSEGLAAVKLGDRWGYINRNGVIVFGPMYDGAEAFSNGRGLVRYKLKYGYVDKSGKLIIPAKFEYASKFSEGLAVVTLPKTALSPRVK
ncbi:MAG: WG repeat-containing protein [Candidatus Obscuribacterales bacterium]